LKALAPVSRLSVLLLAVLLAGGCASYDATVVHGKNLAGTTHFFVLSNLNDNHGLDHQIAAALKARGLQAEIGPRTMMPEDTQAIITYQDRWTWDFGDHLVYLTINARDALSNDAIAAVTYSVSIPRREALPDTVSGLVDRLFTGKKS
jgi:hypothetical protein